MTMRELQEVIRAEIPQEDVASDYTSTSLYVRKSPMSTAIVSAYDHGWMVETFINQVEGGVWYEIPFAKLPEMSDATYNN